MLSSVLDSLVPAAPPSRTGQSRNASQDAGEPFAALVEDGAQSDAPPAATPAQAAEPSAAPTAPAAAIVLPSALAEELALDLIPVVAPQTADATAEPAGEDTSDPLLALLDAVAAAAGAEDAAANADIGPPPDDQADGMADAVNTEAAIPTPAIAAAIVPMPAHDATAAATGEAPADPAVKAAPAASVPSAPDKTAIDAAATPAMAAEAASPSGDAAADDAAAQARSPLTDAPSARGLRANADTPESTDQTSDPADRPDVPLAAPARDAGSQRAAAIHANRPDAANGTPVEPDAAAAPDDGALAAEARDARTPPGAEAKTAEAPARPDAPARPAAERSAVSSFDPFATRAPAFHVLMQQQDIQHAPGTSPAGSDTVLRAVPVSGIAFEIATQAHSGNTRFDIRLDPPELGRIDVRLDVDRHGQVTSRLIVEKSETLDLLRRDAPQLERALQDAGLKTGDNGLEFSLRDQSFSGRDDEQMSGNAHRLVAADEETPPLQGQAAAYGRMLSGGGLDIRV